MKNLLLLLFFLTAFASKGQIRELNFTKLSVENGMPENWAYCSLQDKYGYLWFGTQNGLVRYDGYKVKVYNLETAGKKEQSYRSISTVKEDSAGVIWVGTRTNGLYRYNRNTDDFTHFPHTSKEGKPLVNEITMVVLTDVKGNLWTKNVDGDKKWHVDRINLKTGSFTTYDSLSEGKFNLPTGTYNDLFQDSKGQVWLGTDNGLYRFNAKQEKFTGYLVSQDTARKNGILKIYEAPSQPGVLWLAQKTKAGNALVRFNTENNKATFYKNEELSKGPGSVQTIFEDSGHRLWVGTNKGISRFDRATNTFASYAVNDKNLEPKADSCFDIKEGRNGALWILSGKGLLHLPSTAGRLHRYTADLSLPDGLPSNALWGSLIDRNGGVWVSIRSFGVYRLNEVQSQFEYIHHTGDKTGYPGRTATSIALLKTGGYLVCTPLGLYESDQALKKFTAVALPGQDGPPVIPSRISIDKDGIAWIGSRQHGLFRYNPISKQVINYQNIKGDSSSLSHNHVVNVFEDSKGRLWVGTFGGGLCRLDQKTGKFERFPFIINSGTTIPENGELDDDQVSKLLEDRSGTLWVGTNNGGLNKLDQKTGEFTSFHNNEKGFESVTSIYEDRAGRLWAGTYVGGLFLVDREKGILRRFTEKEGLLYDQVYSIREDAAGNLWLGGGRGYSIFNPKSFAVTTLSSQNGLPSTNMAVGGNSTAPNGDWLVGTGDGILRFNPDQLVSNATLPQIVIEGISYLKTGQDSKEETSVLWPGTEEVRLKHDENRVTFQFTGIHYTNPALNRYQYKLEGYDQHWLDGGNQRTVTYTNLSPGTYTFFVKAANSDGVWNEKAATATVVIRSPWWQTWWAYVLYVLVFAAVVWGYIRVRSKALLRENKVLEEKVTHRTAQLQTSLEELKVTQNQLIQSEKMASLGELTAGIAHEIQNPLNFVNNFSEVSVELLEEMQEELQRGETEEALVIASGVKENLQKISHHGKRADSIVKGMLQHSQNNSGQKAPTDLNALVDEYLRLSYHGLRARDKSFNAELVTDFDGTLPKIEVVAQDLGRVFLNLFNNAFYAVQQKKKAEGSGFHPQVSVKTKITEHGVLIEVSDNGIGIPVGIQNKILQPFFTTKPTGEGTGLGLSLSYDIIVKGHGGGLKIDSQEGAYTTFSVTLPFQKVEVTQMTHALV
ncbi:two-component regulator propeller domain-containing protein [Rufibacter tibetensis]|uniref:two-component regulator propeller domain-containing protein n=1 Tax=Rufibacter tibetensis TaxID=512763 RepID=UPI0007805C91|nr:two-component regulator propeller domain-containing protein [Rufibacter tibetensis]